MKHYYIVYVNSCERRGPHRVIFLPSFSKSDAHKSSYGVKLTSNLVAGNSHVHMARTCDGYGHSADQSGSSTAVSKKSSLKATTLLLTLATFNVLTMTEKSGKRGNLAADCFNFNIDIMAVQETKCRDFEDTMLYHTDNKGFDHKYRFINFEQLNDKWHAGIGFVINAKYNNYIRAFNCIKDRIAFIDLALPTKSGKIRNCRIVNVYGHTQPNTSKKPGLLRHTYQELQEAINVPTNYDLYVLGDFNARLGKISSDDIDVGYSNLMGQYGTGKRNVNGEHLLSFMGLNDLFACNTAFLQPVRHITSRIGKMKDWSAGRKSKKVIPYYSQLDYVLCRKNFKRILVNARSHGGTLTSSDHKMVIARFSLQNMALAFPRKKCVKRLNANCLASSLSARANYNTGIRELFETTPVHTDPNTEMNSILSMLKTAAEENVGFVPKKRQPHHSTDALVVSLSEQRKKLRLNLNSSNKSAETSVMRRQINKCQSDIKKRLKHLDECRADAVAEEINSTDSTRAMFAATRQLAGVKPNSTVSVHDSDCNMIGTDTGKAAALKEYFQKKFTADNTVPPLDPFDGPPKPLTVPITSYEVEVAAKGLKNGRATGPDDIPGELVKYSNQVVFSRYADCLNNSFMTNSLITSFGQGNITPIQKPKKVLGPPANVRPVTCVTCPRKLSCPSLY